MANYKNVPPRRRKPREIKDYRKIYAGLRSQMLDLIEKEGTIGQANLKIKLGWGDGTYNRRKAEVIELNGSGATENNKVIAWNPNTKIFTWIKQGEIEQPLTEKTKESLV